MSSSSSLGQHALSLAAGLGRIDARNDAASGRVSSGRRLDRPSLDSAAVGQAAKIDSEQARLQAAEVNIQNGVSRLQVTSGQLDAISRLVSRLSELSVLGADATQSEDQRALYATEFGELQTQLRKTIGGSVAEIGGVADEDRPDGVFNGRPLFGPGPGDTLVIGISSDETLTMPVLDLRSGALGKLINQDASGAFTFSVTSAGADVFGEAFDQLASAQARVGAAQSRLAQASSLAATAATNREAALSVIQDADLASELTALTRYQLLAESHTAMLTQARDATAKLIPLLSRG